MDGSSVLQPAQHVSEEVLTATIPSDLPVESPAAGNRGRGLLFTAEQREVLLRYFNEYGMTSTHRRNADLMQRCASEINTTVERVKNWIGSEAVKRKRKAGILPRPKIEIAGTDPHPKIVTTPPAKKIKRVNGYNLFFSHCVRTNSDISTDFRKRNAVVAQRWAELTDDDRKQWALKAEAVCSSSIQELQASSQPAPIGVQQRPLTHILSPSTLTPEINHEEALIEKTLLAIQEKFDLLEQLGFEGYTILVNTSELQTHLLATSKGKTFHRMRQQTGKPLENPFIGHVFSDESESPTSLVLTSGMATASSVLKQRIPGIMSSLNSVETMQKSVMNAFSLKYKVATGRSEVPYDNLQNLGVQVYGMPHGIPFHSPLLYNQQQLQQILANLERIVFLKVGPQPLQDSTAPLAEVEISTDSVASLVTPGHDLHIGAEEEASQ